ncbi:MAG: hypothetical protein CEE38_16585 [Planctomycetes bacterium B3_Pla]|nr:MAG: hypothetical protein CEE38_16585 [Planctomycetes bacterium B3_Pla]
MISQSKRMWKVSILVVFLLSVIQSSLFGFTVTVQGPYGAPVNGYRWLVEQDTTTYTAPGSPVADSISLDIHNSYAPVVLKGHSATSVADVNVPSDTRYFVSILPDVDGPWSGVMGGAAVDVNQTDVTVVVRRQPTPTAQISVFVFADQNPINNTVDEHEQGIGGATVVVAEAGGQQMMDAFGNPLGTIYQRDAFGDYVLDFDLNPIVENVGSGVITTLTQDDFDANINPHNLKVGEALIKNIAPGKYGVIAIPPGVDDQGNAIQWIQTSTIEGTPTVDAWVKAREPKLFVEGFGTGFNHAFFGFIKTAPVTASTYKGQTYPVPDWISQPPTGTGTITGRLRLNHLARPPMTQGFFPGDIIGEGWVGLNDPLVRPGIAIEQGQHAGLYAAACNPDGTFVINNVPAGTYQLLTWDKPLDNLFGFHNVTVGDGENVNLGDILVYRWFGTLEGAVFLDEDEDGFRDPGEQGMSFQNINMRFRDGTIYQAQSTDLAGEYVFEEIFPFFKWLVVEVDFARFKATGMTAVVDGGGEVQPDNGWVMPSHDKLNPQPQIDANGVAIVNPNTGNNLSRTETGPVLTEAMHLFLGQSNVIDWGKNHYGPDENGGISGVVIYDTTRAENDPRYCVAEEWQPGIPRVQLNLYMDTNPMDGVIDDLDTNPGPTLADVDNYPFGWQDGGAPGAEDIDRNSNGTFDAGDAIQITTTDCWDDSKPTGSIGPEMTIHSQQVPVGMDAFATWNQIRPGIFDGGYAFDSYFPGGIASGSTEVGGLPTGTYIVESTTPPEYTLVKEEDKNVDFGEAYVPSPDLLPPIPVGDLHTVPAELSLFPGIPCEYAGQSRPLADRKLITLTSGKNAAADFFFFTEVPKAARGVGFVNNDLGAEFNQFSPNFGEKIAPSWIPIALRDWTGREFHRIYCDEFGGYNFLLHSTFSVNVPAPSGVSPHMMTLVLNDPIKPDGTIDEFYNPMYSVTPWTFQYYAGTTSYLDTPLVPLAAFAAADIKIDTDPNLTPVIYSLDGPEPGMGPVISTDGVDRIVTLQSKGTVPIINPAYDPNVPGSPFRVNRDYGFGPTEGQVLLNGTPLVVDSWTDAQIQATVPIGAATGRVTVVRGDNGAETDVGVTLHVVDLAATNIRHVPADHSTIQAAIDTALPGDLILVAPGIYNENVIMNKPVRLQGSASGGTTIFGYPANLELLDLWHQKLNALGAREFASFLLKDPFSENEAPGIIVAGETLYSNGTLQNPLPGTRYFNGGSPFNLPGQTLIDGFTITGSKAGGAVFAISGAANLVVSNIYATGNQGSYAGGIAVGVQDVGFDQQNPNVVIRYNKFAKNGGTQGPGAICMNEYANDYRVEGNLVWGNFSRFNGGGIAHRGYCPGDNVIQFNTIIFNEDHFGALLARAGDGGGIFVGDDIVAGTGTGNVTINSNLIHGNMTGSGYGGGIRAFAVNAEDVRQSPDDPNAWFTLNIFNNIIVNNVAGLGGAGISLQDVVKASIVNNTIAFNDCTATASLAFTAGQLNSTPQPSGVVGAVHSDLLFALFGAGVQQTYSDPLLQNNIIWKNRSWYNDASLNGGQGGLVPRPGSPYWDMAILGSTLPGDPHLNPLNSVLTSQFDPATGFDYGAAANTYSDPAFVASYENQLTSASVLDEGGNFLNVLISPLTIEGSDYHITAGSPAVLAGDGTLVNTFAQILYDYDTQPRSIASMDIGADQISAVAVPVEVIVDNLDAETTSVGVWSPSGASGFWATDSVWANDAGDSFTFNANLAPGNAYAVYGWWTEWSSRFTAVPYEIRSGATLLDSLNVDQQANGGQWNLLGVYVFNDAAASVTVLATPGASTCADAVRFLPLGTLQSLTVAGAPTVDEGATANCAATATFLGGLSLPVQPQVWDVNVAEASISPTGVVTAGLVEADMPAVITAEYTLKGTTVSDTHNITILNAGGVPVEVIVDNLDAETSSVGVWSPSGAAGFWATNSVWANDAGDSFTFTPNLVPGTTYEVYGWWTAWPSRNTAAPYEIRDGAALLDTVNVNQQLNGGQWNLLGTYTFTSAATVTVLASPGSSTNADAVRFVPVTTPVEIIVDNLDAMTSSVGVWSPSGAAGFWATNSVWANDAGDNFTFNANLMFDMTYDVYEWHTEWPSRNAAASHEIRDGAILLDVIDVNQQLLGGQWNLLGTWTFQNIAGSVTVLASPGSSTNADAIRFVPVP